MQFYLLDTDLNIIEVIDTFKSVIWTTRYYEAGDFELYIPATQKMIDLFKRDYYVVRDDDTTQAMIIQNIQITTDVEEGNYLIITGKSLKSILGRRIVWRQTIINGRVESGIRTLVNKNAINPDEPERKIDNLILGAELGLTDKMKSQYTGDNLEETIQGICKTYKIGYDIMLDLDEKQFIFILYKGADRSYNQTANPYVVFSNDYENLLRTDYKTNSDDYKNVAKIAGEGEGNARKTTSVGAATGLNRYEMWVDARDLSTNEGEVDELTYLSLLAEQGWAALAETTISEDMEGEVESNHTYKLNEDYFLGDVVEVVNEYGIAMTPRVTEVIESEDDTGHYTIPTFSTNNDE